MLGEENGDFPALLSAGPFVSCACPGMNMPCCSVSSVQVLPIMLRAFPDFIFLSRPAGQMNSGGRAPKKGMCHCSSDSIHLLSCSPCRKQLVLACHPATKAVCSATCRTCFPGHRCVHGCPGLGRGSEVSSRASDFGSWCCLMLCRSGLACAHTLLNSGCATVSQPCCGRA